MKVNENVKMSYVDAQSYINNYWREIKGKPEFEQIANDKILEWNNKSLKRKGSLLLYWRNLKKTNKYTAETNSSQNSSSSVVVSASRVSDVLKNVLESPPPIVAETAVNVQLNPCSCVTSNKTESISSTSSTTPKKNKSCHAEVKVDSKIVSLSTDIEKLKKVLELNVVPNKEETHSKIKTMKTELSILTKHIHTLKLNRKNKQTKKNSNVSETKLKCSEENPLKRPDCLSTLATTTS